MLIATNSKSARGEKIYDTMADNKEHGTLSPGNRKTSATTDVSNVLENVLKLNAMS
jgi:hypothetical protein